MWNAQKPSDLINPESRANRIPQLCTGHGCGLKLPFIIIAKQTLAILLRTLRSSTPLCSWIHCCPRSNIHAIFQHDFALHFVLLINVFIWEATSSLHKQDFDFSRAKKYFESVTWQWFNGNTFAVREFIFVENPSWSPFHTFSAYPWIFSGDFFSLFTTYFAFHGCSRLTESRIDRFFRSLSARSLFHLASWSNTLNQQASY